MFLFSINTLVHRLMLMTKIDLSDMINLFFKRGIWFIRNTIRNVMRFSYMSILIRFHLRLSKEFPDAAIHINVGKMIWFHEVQQLYQVECVQIYILCTKKRRKSYMLKTLFACMLLPQVYSLLTCELTCVIFFAFLYSMFSSLSLSLSLFLSQHLLSIPTFCFTNACKVWYV